MKKPKRTIRQNVYGNWRGYEGGKFVKEFGTDEFEAEIWAGIRPEPQAVAVGVPRRTEPELVLSVVSSRISSNPIGNTYYESVIASSKPLFYPEDSVSKTVDTLKAINVLLLWKTGAGGQGLFRIEDKFPLISLNGLYIYRVHSSCESN